MPRLLLALALAAALPTAHALDLAPPADLAAWTCQGACLARPADGDITLSPAGSARYGVVATAGSTVYGASPLALDGNSRGVETNGSVITSPAFTAAAGDRMDLWFNYASTDGKGFDDYAWARLLDAASGQLVAWLFTARSSNSSTGNIVPGDVVDRDEFDPDLVIVGYDQFDFQTRDASNPIDWSPLGDSNGSCWKDTAQGCGFTGWLQSRWSFAAAGSYRVEIGVVNWGDEAYDSGLAFDYRGLVSSVPEPGTGAALLAGLAVLAGRRRRPD